MQRKAQVSEIKLREEILKMQAEKEEVIVDKLQNITIVDALSKACGKMGKSIFVNNFFF